MNSNNQVNLKSDPAIYSNLISNLWISINPQKISCTIRSLLSFIYKLINSTRFSICLAFLHPFIFIHPIVIKMKIYAKIIKIYFMFLRTSAWMKWRGWKKWNNMKYWGCQFDWKLKLTFLIFLFYYCCFIPKFLSFFLIYTHQKIIQQQKDVCCYFIFCTFIGYAAYFSIKINTFSKTVWGMWCRRAKFLRRLNVY